MRRGWTETSIGAMPVIYDGDEFQLADLAEIVVSGNKVAYLCTMPYCMASELTRPTDQ